MLTSGHQPGTRAVSAQGFTLLELMVAMTIFALLAAAGWKLFDSLMQGRERTDRHATRLLAAQEAYLQLLRDTRQMLGHAVVMGEGSAPRPALEIGLDQWSMSREAPPDPRIEGRAGVQRIVYRLDQDQLIRERYASAEAWASGQGVPSRLVLLTGVSNWQVHALTPEPQPVWPPAATLAVDTQASAAAQAQQVLQRAQQLPRGLEVQFEHGGETRLWRFVLAGPSESMQEQAKGLMAASADAANAAQGTPSSASPSANTGTLR